MIRQVIQLSVAASVLCTVPVFAQTGQHPQGSLDMTNTKDATPGEYAVLPLARGQKKEVTDSNLIGDEVKGKDGQVIGTLDKMIMDTKTGKIEYGVINLADTHETWPILWNSFKVNKKTGEVTLNLTRDQIPGEKALQESKDLSPDIKKLMKDMQKNMGQPIVNPQGLGVTKQPASGGGQGEDQAGGGGPSGPRGDPLSNKAPGYEGDDKKSR
jgi:sporulation protein YlmC with PRC-barrel domain